MATAFVILFEGRSGSSHLTSLLNSHPNMRARPEELVKIKQRGEGAQEQIDWVLRSLEAPPNSPLQAVGFKTKLRDVIDRDAFTSALHDRRARILHLERQNLVKLAVSSINAARLAKSTGKYNLLKDTDRLPAAPIDVDELRTNITRRAEWQDMLRAYLESIELPILHLTYEGLLAGETRTLGRVFSFLDVPSAPVSSPILKNTPDDLRQAVSNFDELRSHFVGTPFEAMFDS
jgi:LPS sulfotransferase NodH